MRQVTNGDTVHIYYTGRLEDGSVFESVAGGDPFEFKVGDGSLLPGLEAAIIGMQAGESKQVVLSPEEGHGPVREDLIVTLERGAFPGHMTVRAGQVLQITQRDGSQLYVNVVTTTDTTVTVDGNPPLAGQALMFEVEVVSIL